MDMIMHVGMQQQPNNVARDAHVETQRQDANMQGGIQAHSRPNNATHTWADKVRISCSDSASRKKLTKMCEPIEGDKEAVIPEDLMEEDQTAWTRCIVGFTPGQRLPYHAVRIWAQKAWQSFGLEEVMSIDKYFLFRFKDEDSLMRVLELGPWLFGGKAMLLQQWHPHLSFDMNKISKLPVWVRLYNLPFPLWTEKGLSFVSSLVGTPIACDIATHNRSRLQYARICVEIDASRDYLTSLKLKCKLSPEPIVVRVEYEWKPKRCPSCLLYGHECATKEVLGKVDKGKKPMVEKVWKPKIIDEQRPPKCI